MKHYIDNTGKVYGFQPAGIEVREMTDEEFQAYKYAQENPVPSTEGRIANAAAKREALIASADWYYMREIRSGQPVPEHVKAFDAAIRATENDPNWPDVEWPVLPE